MRPSNPIRPSFACCRVIIGRMAAFCLATGLGRWRRAGGICLLCAIAVLTSVPAYAGWTSNVTGTVDQIVQYPPDVWSGQTVFFHISNMPTTGCALNDYFEISAATITDPVVLKNMLATILTAKATGQTVEIGYDSGASCGPTARPRIFMLSLG